MRRATFKVSVLVILHIISIHALREESDTQLPQNRVRNIISIHALREESDRGIFFIPLWHVKFLSTLSVRRATPGFSCLHIAAGNFYPRSP